jgi:hypothetical protein
VENEGYIIQWRILKKRRRRRKEEFRGRGRRIRG